MLRHIGYLACMTRKMAWKQSRERFFLHQTYEGSRGSIKYKVVSDHLL